MFDPRQPRDTGGKWIRLGRGELEQMIDALAHPRAAHIAEVNGKGGQPDHVKVVRRDIKARVLRHVKIAPTYHVKVEGDGARRRVMIQAKGEQGYARAIIPERKSQGNVDVTRFRRGGPESGDAVGAEAFDVQPQRFSQRTEGVREKIRAALPASQREGVGVTDVAKKVAEKKRKRAIPAMTDDVSVKAMHRQIEAAVAAKGIKKAQGDRVKALITRYPPRAAVFGDAADFWADFPDFIKRAAQRRGRGIVKADVEAVQAMDNYLANAGTVGAGMRVKGKAGNDPELEQLLLQVRAADRGAVRDMFAKYPRAAGEKGYDYIQRVRGRERSNLGNNPILLQQVRAMRVLARQNRDRAASAARLREPARREQRGDPFALSNKTLPGGTEWLNKDIADQKQIGGGVNDTWRGTIDGRTVFFKPQGGAYGREIHAGIPPGNDAARERAAYLVGQAMGMDNVAPVVVRDVPGHGKCIVQGGVGQGTGMALGTPQGPKAERDKRAIALFDMVIGNMDRHAKNYTVDMHKGRIYPIDNGLAFAQGPNERGGWNTGFMANFFNGSLTGEELALLEKLMQDDKMWNSLVHDAGLPEEAMRRARRRVMWMVRNKKFLKNAPQLGGNSEKLGGIA